MITPYLLSFLYEEGVCLQCYVVANMTETINTIFIVWKGMLSEFEKTSLKKFYNLCSTYFLVPIYEINYILEY